MIGSCNPFKLQEYQGSGEQQMENSGGRSEINVTDGRGSSRTIAASFFILFSITQVLLQYYLIRLFKLHSNLFGAFTTH